MQLILNQQTTAKPSQLNDSNDSKTTTANEKMHSTRVCLNLGHQYFNKE